MKFLSFLVLLYLFSLPAGIGQTNQQLKLITAGGGAAKASGYYYRWSLGEPIIGSGKGNGYVMANGFQQPVLSKLSTATRVAVEGVSMLVFPNPTTNLVQVKITASVSSSYLMSFYALDGKLLWRIQAEGNVIDKQFNLSALSDGLYLLQVADLKNRKSMVSKIQKIH